jgi:hypothetical protein
MRNYRGSEFNSGYPLCELSLTDFKHIVTPELLAQLIRPEAPVNGLVPKFLDLKVSHSMEILEILHQLMTL